MLAGLLVLVDDLQAVIRDHGLVDNLDVDVAAVVARELVDGVDLHAAALLDDGLAWAHEVLHLQPLPLPVGEGYAVQALHLHTQVGEQVRLGGDGQVVVALRLEQVDECGLELCFALVSHGV